MKKLLCVLLALLLIIQTGAFAATSAEDIIKDSVLMLNDPDLQDEFSSMAQTLKDSCAVAIIPSMFKAGFLLGGEYGEGLILRRKNGKWYGPGFYNIGGGSFGLQLGAQNISLLLAVMNEKGLNAFLNNKTKLGGDIGIAAGPVGRRAEAATDIQAEASIYSYSMTKGLFAGLSLEGSVISISVKRNKEYWNKTISAPDILAIEAKDERIKPLINELEKILKSSE